MDSVSKNLIEVYPSSISQITSSEQNKFLIKFSSVGCRPCVLLQEFLNAGKLRNEDNLLLYQVQIRDPKQEEVFNELRKYFQFNSVPFCVVTNKSLDLIDSYTGFKPEAFTSFIGKHFKLLN